MFGNYSGFILTSYGITIFMVALLILWVIVDGRNQAKALADLEARGIRRRSARTKSQSASKTAS